MSREMKNNIQRQPRNSKNGICAGSFIKLHRCSLEPEKICVNVSANGGTQVLEKCTRLLLYALFLSGNQVSNAPINRVSTEYLPLPFSPPPPLLIMPINRERKQSLSIISPRPLASIHVRQWKHHWSFFNAERKCGRTKEAQKSRVNNHTVQVGLSTNDKTAI